jgi:hypothetical protein
MLINNSDLVKASLWKLQSDLRFETIENQANLISNIFSQGDITERDDLEYDEMIDSDFLPVFYKAEIGEPELYKILNSSNNFYTFVHKTGNYSGYLWDCEVTENKGTLTLLAKNENI